MAEPGFLRLDMHVHSWYSSDAVTDPASIIRLWEKKGILSLVCDHNTTAGAEAVYRELTRRSRDIPRILSEEITTAQGEIIGVFLTDEIPAGLSAGETLDRIDEQGAISLVPHPFCTYRSSALRRETLYDIIGRVDILEGYNARIIRAGENEMALECAARYGKPVSVGSDAHTPLELGRCYMEMEPFSEPKELLTSIDTASVRFRAMHPAIHYLTRMVKVARKNGLLSGV
ncbi:MAG: histidinol phosphatase [Methanoregulaceae archaeon]|nr:histidinol phosphatase [Methanoregulaceae archaeon]